jgi:hypothetical protein
VRQVNLEKARETAKGTEGVVCRWKDFILAAELTALRLFVENWRLEHNYYHPHSILNYMT